jgi:uncharacterized protein YdeI (YjbR/CyaY-like superfamily)
VRIVPGNAKAASPWSLVNLKRMRALIRDGRVHAAGLRAFRGRDRRKSGLYSFEQRRRVALAPRFARLLRANRRAWAFFQAQAPWYRRTAAFWVMSAKQEATRLRRLAALIRDSAGGRPIGPLTRRQG